MYKEEALFKDKGKRIQKTRGWMGHSHVVVA